MVGVDVGVIMGVVVGVIDKYHIISFESKNSLCTAAIVFTDGF